MHNKKKNFTIVFTYIKVETHLLLNVPVNKEDEIIVSNLERGFTLQNEVMQGKNCFKNALYYTARQREF